MHYKDGREAKVGDLVIGTTYNTGGAIIAGTLVSVTPGPDACSALVGYLKVTTADTAGKIDYNWNYRTGESLVRMQGTSHHGNQGPLAVTSYTQDYTECKKLLHAEDAMAYSLKDTAV